MLLSCFPGFFNLRVLPSVRSLWSQQHWIMDGSAWSHWSYLQDGGWESCWNCLVIPHLSVEFQNYHVTYLTFRHCHGWSRCNSRIYHPYSSYTWLHGIQPHEKHWLNWNWQASKENIQPHFHSFHTPRLLPWYQALPATRRWRLKYVAASTLCNSCSFMKSKKHETYSISRGYLCDSKTSQYI